MAIHWNWAKNPFNRILLHYHAIKFHKFWYTGIITSITLIDSFLNGSEKYGNSIKAFQ